MNDPPMVPSMIDASFESVHDMKKQLKVLNIAKASGPRQHFSTSTEDVLQYCHALGKAGSVWLH